MPRLRGCISGPLECRLANRFHGSNCLGEALGSVSEVLGAGFVWHKSSQYVDMHTVWFPVGRFETPLESAETSLAFLAKHPDLFPEDADAQELGLAIHAYSLVQRVPFASASGAQSLQTLASSAGSIGRCGIQRRLSREIQLRCAGRDETPWTEPTIIIELKRFHLWRFCGCHSQ